MLPSTPPDKLVCVNLSSASQVLATACLAGPDPCSLTHRLCLVVRAGLDHPKADASLDLAIFDRLKYSLFWKTASWDTLLSLIHVVCCSTVIFFTRLVTQHASAVTREKTTAPTAITRSSPLGCTTVNYLLFSSQGRAAIASHSIHGT